MGPGVCSRPCNLTRCHMAVGHKGVQTFISKRKNRSKTCFLPVGVYFLTHGHILLSKAAAVSPQNKSHASRKIRSTPSCCTCSKSLHIYLGAKHLPGPATYQPNQTKPTQPNQPNPTKPNQTTQPPSKPIETNMNKKNIKKKKKKTTPSRGHLHRHDFSSASQACFMHLRNGGRGQGLGVELREDHLGGSGRRPCGVFRAKTS